MNNQSQTIVGDHNIFSGTGDVNITYALPPAVGEDRANLLILLNKVRQFWVESVLEQSVHHAVLLELGKETRPQDVDHPWDMDLEVPGRGKPQRLTPNTKISDIFEQTGRLLLILGEPGSGKTITLLELARDLLKKAEHDPTQPVPVIFNLSSWAEKRTPLKKWLLNEFKTKYQIPNKIALTWIDNLRILPLLDGLDEVKAEYRAACLDAINEFAQEGISGIVICSRLQEYLALPHHLKLNGAICLQPLTQSQIDDYLEHAGEGLEALQQLLKEDKELRELSQTPLMLSIMVMAYYGMPANETQTQKIESLDMRRRQLFDLYVEKMFKRKGIEQTKKEKIVYWLSWMAYNLKNHYLTNFSIEEIQPSWLKSNISIFIYLVISRLAIGISAGVTIWIMIHIFLLFFHNINISLIITSLSDFIIFGLVIGIIMLVIIPIVESENQKDIPDITEIKFSNMSYMIKKGKTGLIGGLYIGYVSIIVTLCIISYNRDDTILFIASFIASATYLGLVTFVLSIIDIFSRHLALFLFRLLDWIFPISHLYTLLHIARLIYGNYEILFPILGTLGINSIITMVIMLFLNILNNEKISKYYPSNLSGLKTFGYNCFTGGLVLFATSWVIITILFFIIKEGNIAYLYYKTPSIATVVYMHDHHEMPKNEIYTFVNLLVSFSLELIKSSLAESFPISLIFFILGFFKFGLNSLIKYLFLRMLIYIEFNLFNISKLLNHGCKLNFTQQVGGKYSFYHRYLLEHFAALYEEAEQAKQRK